MESLALVDRFTLYFEAAPARDADARREVLQLRHAVYCEEMGYEPPRPDGMESDDCDPHSMFALVRHRASGRPAGCVRLITHPHQPPGWRFPFERACGERLYPHYLEPDPQRRDAAVEVSRLAVHHDFRRRRGDFHTPVGGNTDAADSADRHYPLIAMGLFLAASALLLLHGIEQTYVMMEPRLARLLHGCGLHFTRVGDLVEHHGQRAPYRILGPELRQDLRPEGRALQDFLLQTLR
jgi:N-acyl amino acid synthase of PEP-CTERM/exosortase system